MENTTFLPQQKQNFLMKAYLRKCIALAWKGQLQISMDLLESLPGRCYIEEFPQEAYDAVKEQV